MIVGISLNPGMLEGLGLEVPGRLAAYKGY